MAGFSTFVVDLAVAIAFEPDLAGFTAVVTALEEGFAVLLPGLVCFDATDFAVDLVGFATLVAFLVAGLTFAAEVFVGFALVFASTFDLVGLALMFEAFAAVFFATGVVFAFEALEVEVFEVDLTSGFVALAAELGLVDLAVAFVAAGFASLTAGLAADLTAGLALVGFAAGLAFDVFGDFAEVGVVLFAVGTGFFTTFRAAFGAGAVVLGFLVV